MKQLQKQLQDTYKISFDDSYFVEAKKYYTQRSKFPRRNIKIGKSADGEDLIVPAIDRRYIKWAMQRYGKPLGVGSDSEIRELIWDEIWEISWFAAKIARRKRANVINADSFKEALKEAFTPLFGYGGTIDKPPRRPKFQFSSET